MVRANPNPNQVLQLVSYKWFVPLFVNQARLMSLITHARTHAPAHARTAPQYAPLSRAPRLFFHQLPLQTLLLFYDALLIPPAAG